METGSAYSSGLKGLLGFRVFESKIVSCVLLTGSFDGSRFNGHVRTWVSDMKEHLIDDRKCH